MDSITTEDCKRIVRRRNYWHGSLHIIWAALLAFSIFLPYHFKHERDHFKLERDRLQEEYSSINSRDRMLQALKARPLTIGQAMEITDAVVEQNKVPAEVILAVMQQESEFNPKAVSRKGAGGLMQVMPVTWRVYSPGSPKNGKDPVQNVRVGILYLGDLFDQYHDWKAVFRAYYAGPQNNHNKRYDWYANAILKKAGDYRREMEK